MRLITFEPDYQSWLPFVDLFEERVDILDPDLALTSNDVLLFEGGTDINPQFYWEERGPYTDRSDYARDNREASYFVKARKAGAAMLGICRGSQLLCALSGSSIIQHVKGHGYSHWIQTNKRLRYHVPSTHHQMMAPSGNFELIAWSEENNVYYGQEKEDVSFKLKGVQYREPEIVFFPETKCLCIQSHPEYLPLNDPFVFYCRGLVKEKLF